ncbi:MAG: HesB/IscA family protein [Mariprofundaceae bacterium]
MNQYAGNLTPDIHFTEAALERLQVVVIEAGRKGVRLAVQAAGCSGLEYVMDFADAPEKSDMVREYSGFSVFVDVESYEKALKGLTVDFQQDALSSAFVFSNPNQKGECGCGASFSV